MLSLSYEPNHCNVAQFRKQDNNTNISNANINDNYNNEDSNTKNGNSIGNTNGDNNYNSSVSLRTCLCIAHPPQPANSRKGAFCD